MMLNTNFEQDGSDVPELAAVGEKLRHDLAMEDLNGRPGPMSTTQNASRRPHPKNDPKSTKPQRLSDKKWEYVYIYINYPYIMYIL